MTADQSTNKESYLELVDQVLKHDSLYFQLHAPEITDEEYDLLFQKLIYIESVHPDWIVDRSPTQSVKDAVNEGFSSYSHHYPMKSLEKSFTKDSLEDFLKRCSKNLNQDQLSFVCEPKLDGLAISLRYEKGVLVQALTRGNGIVGDDVTAQVKTIESLPHQLIDGVRAFPDTVEVRGEVYMTKEVFHQLNSLRQEKELTLFANPRNAAAGSLKLLDPSMVAERKLSISIYDIANPYTNKPSRHFDVYALLKDWGLPVIPNYDCFKDIESLWAFVDSIYQQRPFLAYDIDGVVIKLDHYNLRDLLGETNKHPRWAIACKFSAERALTQLKDITLQVGRTGVITPVAELDPILLSGSVVSRATLHNVDEVLKKGICIGDMVWIEKGGDIIPQVIEVDTEKRLASFVPWQPPTQCPCCQSMLIKEEGQVALRCPNKECASQNLQKLIHFCSKAAMDIQSLGKKMISKLYDLGLISTFHTLYQLTLSDLLPLEGVKEKSAGNIISALDQSKNQPLHKLIFGLGIRHVGEGAAKTIADVCQTLDGLLSIDPQKLLDIDGFGQKVVESIETWVKDDQNIQEVYRLKGLGVNPKAEEKVESSVSGKTFVITGTLEKYSRQALKDLVVSFGGSVTGSVSKKTDFLIAGGKAGSKLKKAQDLGVVILSEEAFLEMIR